MREDESPTRCYCIVPNGSQSSILVREVDGRYECPSVLLPWLRLKFFPDHVPFLRQELRRATRLDMTVRRHLQDLDDVQICLMEVHSAVGPVPDGYLWLGGHEGVRTEWADEPSRRAWQAWLASQADEGSLVLAPWERAGWFADAQLWIQARLHEAGHELMGPIDQFKGAWAWSSILTAETDKGAVYFKADYDRPPKEVAVASKLAERWPQNMPHIIAADVERGWMLMSDFGGVSLQTLDTSHSLNAVSLFAEIQRSTALDIHEWESLGCPDMTPENLIRMARRLFADTSVLCEGEGGLSHKELTELERRSPHIDQMLTLLTSSALPNTISNEDFKAGNVAVSGGEYVFYDWGNTVITHPMFGINYFLNRIPRPLSEDGFRWRNHLEDETRRALMSAFLAQWTDYASLDQLTSEFWLCRRLYPLYEAVKCHCDLPFVGTASPWGAGSLAYIPQAIRKLIMALDA